MFEPVHTMTSYYDGPRSGIAQFHGVPHAYESRWSDIGPEADDTYLLMPIAGSTLELALEDQAIWLRWSAALEEGRTTQQTHPVLPEDSARSAAVSAVLKGLLVIDETKALFARAEFRVRTDQAPVPGWIPLEVEWTPINCVDHADNRKTINFP